MKFTALLTRLLAKPGPDQIQWTIRPEQKPVADITEMRQPFGVRGHRVKFMPMHYQQTPAIGGLMDGVRLDGDVPENT